MHRKISVDNLTHALPRPINTIYCDSFTCRLCGLMFQRPIGLGEGFLLVKRQESYMNASIHTLFMMFDMAVIWINHTLNVVDRIIAQPWRFVYLPSSPAQYVLETNTDNLENFHIGDLLSFE